MALDVWRCIVLQGVPAFREPDLRWWQRRRVAPADAASSAELQHLEHQLTVEQVSHFRSAATDRSAVLQSSCCLLEGASARHTTPCS